jgi:TonB family protein
VCYFRIGGVTVMFRQQFFLARLPRLYIALKEEPAMFLRKVRIFVIPAILFCASVTLVSRAQNQTGKPPVVPPHPVKLVKPDCGDGRSCHGIHGVVVVIVDVLTDGTVGDATVDKGDPRLADAALKAAKQCRFQPGTLLGKPTSMNFDLKYQF